MLNANWPENFHLVEKDISEMPIGLHFDMVLIHDKLGQYEAGRKIADFFQIPLVLAEHYHVVPGIRPQDLMNLNSQRYDAKFSDDVNISASWKQPPCLMIKPGVENRNKITDRKQILVYGNFSASDYNILTYLLENVPNIKLCGTNQNLPSQAVTLEELENEIDKSLVYINLSISSNLSYPMLDAMANNCLVVSNVTDSTNSLFGPNHEYLVKNAADFPALINKAISNRSEILEIQRKIIKSYSLPDFVAQWDQVIKGIKGYKYAVN